MSLLSLVYRCDENANQYGWGLHYSTCMQVIETDSFMYACEGKTEQIPQHVCSFPSKKRKKKKKNIVSLQSLLLSFARSLCISVDPQAKSNRLLIFWITSHFFQHDTMTLSRTKRKQRRQMNFSKNTISNALQNKDRKEDG